MISVPSQKLGSDRPMSPPMRATTSMRERERIADRRPSGRPMTTAINVAAAASSRVAGSRSVISTSTGRPVRISQVQYCWYSGWSRPKYARRLASCSGVSAVEVPSRAAMASPGISRMNRNVRTDTPSSVGIAPSSRVARYRPTRR